MKTIGIIGAMPSELVDIRLGLPDSEIQKKAGFDYYINQVGDTRIVHAAASQRSTQQSAPRRSSTISHRTLSSMPALQAA